MGADANPEAVARAIVLRQLTNSPKSRLQLARKLAERNVPETVAEAVLDRFEEVRLIDDAEFAEMWVRSRAQSRKLARGALRRELADKGIDAETAEGALAQLSDEDERNAARDLVARRLRAGVDLSDRAERDKQTRRLASMLARKGYQPSAAFRIVGEVLDEALARSWTKPWRGNRSPGTLGKTALRRRSTSLRQGASQTESCL
ncbi:regulatory protein [Arthrobacter sp. AZCC_0090]|nr:regulatory protein [Arthrobacter sp. AZCC_0090]